MEPSNKSISEANKMVLFDCQLQSWEHNTGDNLTKLRKMIAEALDRAFAEGMEHQQNLTKLDMNK